MRVPTKGPCGTELSKARGSGSDPTSAVPPPPTSRARTLKFTGCASSELSRGCQLLAAFLLAPKSLFPRGACHLGLAASGFPTASLLFPRTLNCTEDLRGAGGESGSVPRAPTPSLPWERLCHPACLLPPPGKPLSTRPYPASQVSFGGAWRHFWLSHWEGEGSSFWKPAGRSQDAAKHLTMHRPVLHTKERSCPVKHFPGLRTKNPQQNLRDSAE